MTIGLKIQDIRDIVKEYDVSFEKVIMDYNKIERITELKYPNKDIHHDDVCKMLRERYNKK